VVFSISITVAKLAIYFFFGQSGFTIGGAVRFAPGSMTSNTPFCFWLEAGNQYLPLSEDPNVVFSGRKTRAPEVLFILFPSPKEI